MSLVVTARGMGLVVTALAVVHVVFLSSFVFFGAAAIMTATPCTRSPHWRC